MIRILLCIIYFFTTFIVSAWGIYEKYSFPDKSVEREWGRIWIHLLESPSENNGKYIQGSPYELSFLIYTNMNEYIRAKIVKLKILYESGEVEKYTIKKDEDIFEKSSVIKGYTYIAGISIYPFETLYENQTLVFILQLFTENEIIEEEIYVDLKINKKKWIGLHLWEQGKDI